MNCHHRSPFYFLLPVVANRHLRHFTLASPFVFFSMSNIFLTSMIFCVKLQQVTPLPRWKEQRQQRDVVLPEHGGAVDVPRRDEAKNSRRWGRETRSIPHRYLPTNSISLFLLFVNKIIDLPRGQNKQPPSGRKFLSFLPSCNSVVSVSEP